MLLHAFLSGLGIALSYTVITTLIIDTHNVHNLPELYVITSVALLISGYVYSKLEHSFQPARLFKAVLIALSLWGLAMALNLKFGQDYLVIAIAFCSYYLVYYLSNLEYWGSASLLFDVRQGKRLFGLLSVGESLAKIMGYAITPLIISLLDVSGVFIVVAVSFGGAFLIFRKLTRAYRSALVLSHLTPGHHGKSGTVITHMSIRKIFRRDKFKIFVSIFALISSLSYFLIHYAFLVRIEERFFDLEHIAVFIATLLSIAKFLNLSIKIFLSGRLFQLLGLKHVLLLLPVTLLVISLVGVTGIFTGQAGPDFIIWVFTIIFVADEVLRTSLYTPAYLTLFQPLTKAKRLEGHTLTKGIMEPIGIGIAGGLIILLLQTGLFNLEYLKFIILFWLVVWIIAGLELYKSYLDILKNALKTKLLNRGTLQLNKEELRMLKEEKLASSDPVEQLYALQMLGNRIPEKEINHIASNLLRSHNDYILLSILDFISTNQLSDLAPEMKALIFHQNNDISKKAIHEYSRMMQAECIPFYMSIFKTIEKEKRNALIAASIKNGGLSGAIEFGRSLLEMIDSDSPAKRADAAEIIGEINNQSYYMPLEKLIHDHDYTVVRSAIRAAGKLRHDNLIEPLLKAGQKKKLFLETMKSLAHFGNTLALKVREHMRTKGPAKDIIYIKLLSNNTSQETTRLYEECLSHPVYDVRRAAVTTLFQRSYKESQEGAASVQNMIDLVLATLNLLQQYFLKLEHHPAQRLIHNEIYHIQLQTLYQLLAFRYPRKAMIDIINNSYAKENEFRSIALELLENTLNARDSRMIIPLIDKLLEQEPAPVIDQNNANLEEFCQVVISDANRNFSSWITANAIRYAGIHKPETHIPTELTATDITVINQELKIFTRSKIMN